MQQLSHGFFFTQHLTKSSHQYFYSMNFWQKEEKRDRFRRDLKAPRRRDGDSQDSYRNTQNPSSSEDPNFQKFLEVERSKREDQRKYAEELEKVPGYSLRHWRCFAMWLIHPCSIALCIMYTICIEMYLTSLFYAYITINKNVFCVS